MLTEFRLKNFKSFQQQASLPLGPLTVLIGANAAGKSNAIEALRLLSWLAQGNKLGSIQSAVNQGDALIRGRLDDVFRRGESVFSLGGKLSMPGEPELTIEVGLRDGELHIVQERLHAAAKWLYQMERPSVGLSTDAGVSYNNFASGPNKPMVSVSDQMAVFVQLDSPASFQAKHKQAQQKIPLVCRAMQTILSGILFLDPVPARMRAASFLVDKRLGGDGSNLSSVLHRLWHDETQETPSPREEILSFIQSLPEQDIAGLDFLQGLRGEVMVQLIETFSGEPRRYEAALLSDGTLRVLAIASAMLSAPEGSLVVIEEIDNGVHPSRARHLLERIQAVAERRQLRVLLSTHNPAMLDALPDKAVPDVVFCYRDPVGGDSRLVRLGSLEDGPELLIQDTLGHLMTSGALERFVKHHPGPEVRKQKAKAWLASLKQSRPEAAQ